jgi:hypothetical protein
VRSTPTYTCIQLIAAPQSKSDPDDRARSDALHPHAVHVRGASRSPTNTRDTPLQARQTMLVIRMLSCLLLCMKGTTTRTYASSSPSSSAQLACSSAGIDDRSVAIAALPLSADDRCAAIAALPPSVSSPQPLARAPHHQGPLSTPVTVIHPNPYALY